MVRYTWDVPTSIFTRCLLLVRTYFYIKTYYEICAVISGILIWRYNTAGGIFASPAVGPDGIIYAVSCIVAGCSIYAVTSTGKLILRYCPMN